MRTIIFLAALLFASAAQAFGGDTLVVEQARRVTVVNHDSLLRVSIDGKPADSLYHYEAMLQAVDSNYVSKEKLGKDFSFDIMGFNRRNGDEKESDVQLELHWTIGFNTSSGSPQGMSVDAFESSDWGFWFGVNKRIGHSARHRFTYGLGLNWRCFRMTGRNQFVKSDDGVTSIQSLPEGCDPKFSRIKVFSLVVPLLYHYSLNSRWGFSFGPVIHCVGDGGASILTRYTLDGEKHKAKYKRIHPNPVTVDLMAAADLPWVTVYVRYNPCNVLDSRYAPTFHSLSFGFEF